MFSIGRRIAQKKAFKPYAFEARRCFGKKSPFFEFLEVSQEVREAVHNKKPVVALETTIYTHGFPYPDNIALSSLLESTVRANGGVPATVGVLNGVAKVGMDPEEIIELLQTAGSSRTVKVSRRDLSYIIGSSISGRKMNGGTTIAGTMVLAHIAGIKVFATGGLGGVHRGGENSMDVSADLTELGRTPMALVSSGCKSFLDIPRTLEYLETQGVGVGTFADGRDGPVDFPAFWTRNSGTPSPTTIASEQDAAAMLFAQLNLPLSSGLLFANPISEEHSLPKDLMDEAMAQAIKDAADQGISGSNNTPFVLSRIREITSGSTIAANRALVEANVARGTKVAVEFAKLDMNYGPSRSHQPVLGTPAETSKEASHTNVDVLVAGSIAMDLSCDYIPTLTSPDTKTPQLKTSNPATISHSLGGVGQNVATASHYSGARTQLCSLIGDDPPGKAIIAELQHRSMDTSTLQLSSGPLSTAQYVAVNDSQKDLVLAMADMRILEHPDVPFDTRWKPTLQRLQPKWVVVDGNWAPQTLKQWISAARAIGAKVAYEPVSVEKSTRLLHEDWKSHLDNLLQPSPSETRGSPPLGTKLVDIAAPNEREAVALADAVTGMDAWTSLVASLASGALEDNIRGHLGSEKIDARAAAASLKLLARARCVLTKFGPQGVVHTESLAPGDPRLTDPEEQKYVLCRKASSMDAGSVQPRFLLPEAEEASSLSRVAGVYMRHYPVPEEVDAERVVSVNGVGDTFLGIVVAGLAREEGRDMAELVQVAQRGAALTLQSRFSVSPEVKGLRL